MHTELYSISKIFTECLFRIPDYQRGYAWTERQLKDFWTDLEQLEDGKNHYTGVLTLEEVPRRMYGKWEDDLWIIDSKKFKPYHVVDGQQRLTTVVILLQVLIERLQDDDQVNYTPRLDIRRKFIYESRDKGISRSYIFGYEKDNPSYEFLKTSIFNEASDTHSTLEETVYTQNMSNAKTFFAKKLSDLDLGKLEALYTKITQHFLFNIYTISDGIDVFVAFETMNNRGKPLSQLELLKNRLIFLSTKLPGDATERAKLRSAVNECWKTLYYYLGRNKKNPLSDDEFLQKHFMLYFGPRILQKMEGEEKEPSVYRLRREDFFKEYLLDEVFTIRNLVPSTDATRFDLSLTTIYDYARNIKEFVRLYFNIHNPADSVFPDRERILLERLNRIANYEARIVTLAAFLRDDQASIGSRFRLLELLERLRFLSTITYIRKFEDLKFEKMALDIHTGKLDVKGASDRLEKLLSTILKEMDFQAAMLQWTKKGGYYDWRAVKYFLFEYEQHLRHKSKNSREKLTWDEFSKESYGDDYETIEHIYPQTATADCWKERFNHLARKQRNTLKNSIGNLVPLSKPKNSALRNNCFDEKRGSAEQQVGYAYGCYSENEIALCRDWNANEILNRGVRLLTFMELHWEIPLGSEQDKIRTLGLAFVLGAEMESADDLESE